MMETLLAHTGGIRPRSFGFRGLRPIHVNETIHIEGQRSAAGWSLWLRDNDGALRMSATTQD